MRIEYQRNIYRKNSNEIFLFYFIFFIKSLERNLFVLVNTQMPQK